MTDDDPRTLLHRCLTNRCADDWQRLVDRHGLEIRRTVRRAAVRVGLPLASADLDEMVQDLYCRLLSIGRERFAERSEHDLWHYVYHAAHSLVVDRRRRDGARKRRPQAEPGSFDLSRLPSPKLNPEERLLKKERRRLFFERCFEVVRSDRVKLELWALTMTLLEGWSSRDVARRLKGSLSACQVDSLVHRLRRHLERDGIRMPRRYCHSISVPAGC